MKFTNHISRSAVLTNEENGRDGEKMTRKSDYTEKKEEEGAAKVSTAHGS